MNRAPDGIDRSDADQRLDARHQYGMRFGLERIELLTSVLGRPQDSYDSIHVVGTNGKSSTTRMISALLQGQGCSTGAYLSPHLHSFTERIELNGKAIAEEAFDEAVAVVDERARELDLKRSADDQITQFELLTAAAFYALAEAGVQVAVIEAGLGGRLDSTNVLNSKVQVLTGIDLEHTELLGDSIEQIAAEKLAVVKPNAKLVVGAVSPSVLEMAVAVAVSHATDVVQTRRWYSQELGDTPELLFGYQLANLDLAVTAAEAYYESFDHKLINSSIAGLELSGRLEVVTGEPTVIFDSAHNPAGLKATLGSLQQRLVGQELVAVVALLDDKDSYSFIELLGERCQSVFLTTCDSDRTVGVSVLSELQDHLSQRFARLEVIDNPSQALSKACEVASSFEGGGTVLVTGSNYLVGQLRSQLS